MIRRNRAAALLHRPEHGLRRGRPKAKSAPDQRQNAVRTATIVITFFPAPLIAYSSQSAADICSRRVRETRDTRDERTVENI